MVVVTAVWMVMIDGTFHNVHLGLYVKLVSGAHFNVSCDRDDGRSEDDDDEDDDDEDDDDDDFIFEDAPCREDEESSSDYFKRTERYWMQQAETMMTGKGSLFSDRTLLRLARDMCQGALDQH